MYNFDCDCDFMFRYTNLLFGSLANGLNSILIRSNINNTKATKNISFNLISFLIKKNILFGIYGVIMMKPDVLIAINCN